MCFPSQIVRFFAEADNTELIDLSVSALTIFAFAYLFRWIGFSTQSFLLAIEKPAPATLISICVAPSLPDRTFDHMPHGPGAGTTLQGAYVIHRQRSSEA